MSQPKQYYCTYCGGSWLPGYEHSVGECRDWLYSQKSQLKAALHELTGYKQYERTEFWSLHLNRYQRDNLLWLLVDLIGWGGDHGGVEPFTFAHTGDWVGEIGFQLEDGPKERRANVAVDYMRERVLGWRAKP